MLSDDAIEKLMQPIIDRQENINNYVIGTIAKRLKQIGQLGPGDINRLQLLVQSGADIKKINLMLAKQSGLQVKDIKKVIKAVAKDDYADAKPFYDYRHKSFIPLEKNKKLNKITNAISNQTAGTYKNISDTRATGFILGNGKKKKFKKISDAYRETIDEAIQAVETGNLTYEAAVKRAIKQLTDSGVRRIYWDSGYTKRVDAAVRQSIHDGIKALHLQMQREIAKQIGADGWRLSAHENSAPDHEPIQGHAFTLEEFENLQNNKPFKDTWGNSFGALKRVIGQWNCKHWARAIILGKDTGYKQETLQKYIDNNKKGYTLPNGKHLTMYECTQYQRQMESKIRDAKEAQMVAVAAGDLEEAKKWQAKVSQYTKEYQSFSNACGLGVKKDKIAVSGYKIIKI